MTPKIISITAAAAMAAGSAFAVPAAAAAPAAPAASSVKLEVSRASTEAVPIRHYRRNGAYCRRQYRLGFVLGQRGARVFFNRHCHARSRGDYRRGRHWDRGYDRGPRYHRRHDRRHRRSYRNSR